MSTSEVRDYIQGECHLVQVYKSVYCSLIILLQTVRDRIRELLGRMLITPSLLTGHPLEGAWLYRRQTRILTVF